VVSFIGFDSRKFKIFLFFRPALRPSQPPVQWVPGSVSTGVKLQGREADQSSAEVKNGGAIPAPPHMSPLHSAQLIVTSATLPSP
jgi:hypothetical protein